MITNNIKTYAMVVTCSILAMTLVGCGGSTEFEDSFSFTEEDAEEISALLDRIEDEQVNAIAPDQDGEAINTDVVLDVSQAHRYAKLRTSVGSVGEDTFRVTNVFLNVREGASVHSKQVEQLKEGDLVRLLDFPNSRWAHIELIDGRKGYVSTAYISQVVTEEDLASVKKKYEGLYEVNFNFLNVRSEQSSQSQKLGELMGHQLVRPLSIEGKWAKVDLDGEQGFVSSDYLRPFLPSFIVRQEYFSVPVLHYRGDDTEIADALVKHIAFLKSNGRKIITMSDFYRTLELQEERDVRLSDESVILVVSEVNKQTMRDIADALRASGVNATFFIRTSQIGGDGISPQSLQALSANGNDVQSAGHKGEDLRSLTNSEVALDFAQSRQIIEDITGAEVFSTMYPRGGVNDRVAEQAIETGYLFGVTLTPSIGTEGFSRSQFLKMPSNLVTANTTEGTIGMLVGL
ncbi:SH3 domain-containing protein [Candidatus Peribacteria bacterium]|jgi:peptidoglycan/xylan/chitin deacetylase (PgdA/CDA1 family)/uncharacterized protein YgiM (DUF1202 family)|nr:SH3 domain-containing protein [Candidatus Peribacteria bacterium]MBT4021314.1 SH3 domain-containing protein [Candidatus Peribacteria bacterium]MBT4241225.1 SH3 domain-containing protein [Candidatus Peribacteria bacterium]MBT4474250.1 SH3 domain-containing protein [Candidatus Peribacteria bacterium]